MPGPGSLQVAGHVVAEGYVQFGRECFPELNRLHVVDDDVLEMRCAGQRRQVIAAQVAAPVAAWAEAGQAQVAAVEEGPGQVASGEFRS